MKKAYRAGQAQSGLHRSGRCSRTFRGCRSSRASTAIASSRTRSSTGPSSARRATGASMSCGTFGNGLVNYQVSAINGAGYKTLSRSPTRSTLKAASASTRSSRSRSRSAATPASSARARPTCQLSTPHTATRFDALAAYTDKRIRAGVEYFAAKNWNNVTLRCRRRQVHTAGRHLARSPSLRRSPSSAAMIG